MQLNFKGVPVFLNGKEYIVPSLSLRQVQDNLEALSDVPAVDASADGLRAALDIFRKYIPVIAMAIQRNYPDVTEEDLWNWVSLDNFGEILAATQGASGFKAVGPGEMKPAS